MKKLTLTFLTLLMVMPSMVCGMSLCPMQKAQAAEVGAEEHIPCHQKSEKDTDSKGGVMLMHDCMGVDLQKSDTASIDKPDLKIDFVVYSSLTDILTHQIIYIDSNTIRGPPFGSDIVANYLPIYQTSKRFRI